MPAGDEVARGQVDHTPGRPQAWATADIDVQEWCRGSVDALIAALGSVVGVYLHGSLATGSYYRPKSDLDLMIVTESPLDAAARRRFAVAALASFDRRPTAGGVEVSVVDRTQLNELKFPMSFEAHFSERWAADVRRGGIGPTGADADLAAHCVVTRRRGIALAGAGTDLLPNIPAAAFHAAVLEDFAWIVDGENLLASPYYGVLNICRTLQLCSEPDAVASKDEGAEWALRQLAEEHHEIIHDSLSCYRSSAPTHPDERRTHGHSWDHHALLAFRDFARAAQRRVP